MTCMVNSRPKQGTGPFFKFFNCSNDFIMQKVYYFSRLMRSNFGLIMLSHEFFRCLSRGKFIMMKLLFPLLNKAPTREFFHNQPCNKVTRNVVLRDGIKFLNRVNNYE